MNDLTNAERLMVAFENMPHGSSLALDQVAPFIRGLGGNIDAVDACRCDASIAVYIAALTVRYIQCCMVPDREDRSNNRALRMPNTGHGHVYPRDDGVRMRCGGPGICKQCNVDQAIKDNS